jgi:hypothetical protein
MRVVAGGRGGRGTVTADLDKLHQWATDDPGRRFDDLYIPVADPAVLVVAWMRVRGNRGKRSAGVHRVRPDAIFSAEEEFLRRLRKALRAAVHSSSGAGADDP